MTILLEFEYTHIYVYTHNVRGPRHREHGSLFLPCVPFPLDEFLKYICVGFLWYPLKPCQDDLDSILRKVFFMCLEQPFLLLRLPKPASARVAHTIRPNFDNVSLVTLRNAKHRHYPQPVQLLFTSFFLFRIGASPAGRLLITWDQSLEIDVILVGIGSIFALRKEVRFFSRSHGP